jgi:ribonuclease D
LILEVARWAANPKGAAEGPKLPRHFTGRRLASFKEALSEARGLAAEEWPEPRLRVPRTHGEPDCREAIDALRAQVERMAAELAVDASVLAPKAATRAIAREKPGTVEEIMGCADLMRWQAELLLPVVCKMRDGK